MNWLERGDLTFKVRGWRMVTHEERTTLYEHMGTAAARVNVEHLSDGFARVLELIDEQVELAKTKAGGGVIEIEVVALTMLTAVSQADVDGEPPGRIDVFADVALRYPNGSWHKLPSLRRIVGSGWVNDTSVTEEG